jgi:1-acyl-sn-glycerol-3-phosphate acyltransferase
MAFLRLCVRTTLTLLLTLGWFGLFCIGLPCAALSGRRLGWRDSVLHLWSRTMLAVLGVAVRVEGPIPRGGCLVVSNHLSYLDVLVLAAQRPFSFLSKADVARWPVIGWMARVIGVQFIVREDKRSLPKVAAALAAECAAGHGVLFFPEGTSSAGEGVLPFRPALLAPAAESGLPVHHAAICYATPAGSPPARDAVCWWGDMEFAPHALGLMRLPSVEARVRFGDAAVRDGDRKELARRLQAGVAADLAKLTGPAQRGSSR